jgi:hypothetical protein
MTLVNLDLTMQRFQRPRARTPPETHASFSSADLTNSTRPFDSNPPAPAKFMYGNGLPRTPPKAAHLHKPNRIPSGPRVAPPNFANMKTLNREERYSRDSRPSFAASSMTRPTSEETDDYIPAVVGKVIKTDIRKGAATITPNWVRTKRVQEDVSA